MEKKYFYFQPRYVNKFKCDGSKCNAHCCGRWSIFIDENTFRQYPPEITAHMQFNSDKKEYRIVLDENDSCPFLNENKLCGIQLKYGESFLSQTCATYPRVTSYFGYFFERALALSCPVAAEIILFEREPMQFEFVNVPEEIHSPGGKMFMQKIQAPEELKAHLIKIQVAMISILQERTLSIDQRLIVLGFFLDRLEEIFSADFDEAALTKLIAAYESKKFLAEQVPLMLQSVTFDVKNFIRTIINLLEKVFGGENANDLPQDKKFMDAVCDVLELETNEKNFVSISKVATNYKKLSDARKKFLTDHATILENYLVNELFMNIYPWRFEAGIAQNFDAFVAEYKLFELITFCASIKGFSDKKNWIELAAWFVTRFDHTSDNKQRVFDYFKGNEDPFSIMESLLEGSD